MAKTQLTLALLPLVAIIILPQVFALEPNESYFLDDNESISILVEVDSNGMASITEIFVNDENGSTHVIDMDNAKFAKVTSDHSFGKVFGKTFDGDYALVIFKIDDNDQVSLKAKIWADDGAFKIITNGEIISLF